MFLDFYKMKEQPFGVTPDPRFLYLGKSHREALASLYYGIEANRGFVALIAPPGLGKTTLTFQLLQKLQQASRTVFLFQTQCNSKELFHYLLNGLGVDAEGMEMVSMHNKLNQILSREMLAGRRFILAVDEAQNLDPQVLESIRLLSNFETSQAKLLQILLIGQPALARKLANPELEQLQQRISMFAKLEPFGFEDTARYISHRLRVAGYEGGPLFAPGALRMIAEQSLGVPRKINSLCFSALSLGCALDSQQIDAGMMEEVIADRDVQSLQQPRAAERAAPAAAASRAVLSPPMISRPAMFSYQAKPRKSLNGWALGAATIAACVAIGIGILSFSPGKIDWSIEQSSEAWTAIRNGVASIGGFASAKSDEAPASSSLNVQAAGLSNSEAGLASPEKNAAETDSVIVQPGEKLRQVILRTVGEYNSDTIEQIRRLNPGIADLDNLEPGQTIRFPRATAPTDSGTAGEPAPASGKN